VSVSPRGADVLSVFVIASWPSFGRHSLRTSAKCNASGASEVTPVGGISHALFYSG